MIIHYLRVKNFCGIDDRAVTLQSGGVTIIEGANETGKSSLARALYIVLDHKDSTTKASVKAIKPVGRDVGPEIEADIESGPYRFCLHKRFLKEKATKLTINSPQPKSLTGDEAHDEVQRILSETMDMGLWKALNIIQGVDDTKIPANSALSNALDRSAGTVSMGSDEMTLFDLAREERERYFTESKGAPKGEYKRCLDDVDRLKEELKGLRADLDAIDADGRRLANLEAELADVRGCLEEADAHARSMEAELEKAGEVMDEIESLAARIEGARRESERLHSERGRRDGVRQELEDARKEFDRLSDAHSMADVRHGEAQREVDGLQESADMAKTELDELEERLNDLQGHKDHLHQVIELEDIGVRISKAEEAIQRQEAAKADMVRHRVDADALKDIKKLDVKAVRLRAALESELPRIAIDALSDVEYVVNGERISRATGHQEVRPLQSGTEIEVPGLIRLKVQEGGGRSKAREEYDKVSSELKDALLAHGVDSYEEAIESNRALEDAARRLEASTEDQERLIGDFGSIDEMRLHRAEVEELVNIYRSEDRSEMPKEIGEVNSLIKALKPRIKTAKDAYNKYDKQLKLAKKDRDDAADARSRAKAEVDQHIGMVGALQRQIESMSAEEPDDALDARTAESDRLLSSLEQEHDLKRSELGPADPATLEEMSRKAREAADEMRLKIAEKEREVERCRGSLESRGVNGAYEKAADKEREFEQESKRLASLKRQAEAADYLYQILAREREIALRDHQRPLKERIDRLGRILYGDQSFEVALNDELEVVSRTIGGETVEFSSLSTGAQEQIGLIVKLACAMIVSSEGGVPIILDDALGHTDPSRIKMMNSILNLASKECQIIVLTCYPSRYSGIAGASVFNMSHAATAGQP